MRGSTALTHGPGDVRCARSGVAGGEDVRDDRLERALVGDERAVGVDGDGTAEGRALGSHADCHQDGVARDHEFAALDGLRAAAARGVGRPKSHALTAQPRDLAGVIADDLDGRDKEAELHAVVFGVVDLGLVGRHLFTAAAIRHGRFGGAEADGGARGIHGHVAAAHDHDALARQIDRPAKFGRSQELEARHHAVQVLAGDVEAGRGLRAGRHEDGVETVAAERLHVGYGRIRGDLNSERGHVGDVLLHDLGGEAVGWDGQPQEAAGDGCRLEDFHAVTKPGELPGGGQACRARPHDGDVLAVGRRDLDTGTLHGGVVLVRRKSLQAPDGQRPLERAAGAVDLARGVASAAKAADQRRRVEH